MADHHFYLKANWPGNRNDVGTIESGNLITSISIPKEMDGPGEGTNPDEMLLGAAATCYIITLAAMMERSGLKKKTYRWSQKALSTSQKESLHTKRSFTVPLSCLNMMLHKMTSHWLTSFVKKRRRHA